MILVLHNVLPVFALIALGGLLGRLGMTGPEFYRTADRLIYFIFLPALLFWKTGNPSAAPDFDWPWVAAVCGALIATHLLCLAWVRVSGMPRRQVGSFCQGAYRFNTYIGMAIVLSVYGEPGVSRFSLLVGFAIPLINILAISALVWYSDRDYSGPQRIWMVVRSIITNPLVIACAAGITWARPGIPFPGFMDNTLRLLSLIALPLALLSIGASLTFDKLDSNLGVTLTACFLKLVLMPLGGWLLLRLAGSTGLDFAVAMVFFALPTSTASYILSAQLGSDPDLATAEIVLTTLLSIVALSLVIGLAGGPAG